MQSQDVSTNNQRFNLTISEQFVYLIEIITQNGLDDYFKQHFLYATIGSCFADLFMMNKIKLVDNRIVFNNGERTNIRYIDRLIDEINAIREDKTIFDVLMALDLERMLEIESMINDALIKKKLLYEKREGFLMFGKKVITPIKNDYSKQLIDEIRTSLDSSQEPDQSLLYLLAVLKPLDILPNFYESLKELDFGKKRMESLIEYHHDAKMILRAIENQIKLKDLEHMPKQKGTNLGMGGRL